MTKKEFKSKTADQVYTGRNIKVNALYFDFQRGSMPFTTPEGLRIEKIFAGFAFMVRANSKDISKKELQNALYNWVVKGEKVINEKITCRQATTNFERFKMPISI